MIKQVAHLCIHARDLAETERFYCGVLGLSKGFVFERNEKPFGFYLRCGANTFIEVFQGEPGAVGNINHLCLEVDDIDRLVETLRTAGVQVTDKKLGADQSWQAWASDPNGVRIEFHAYTPESMQTRGGVCRVDW